jgi:hypothetical protein
MDDDHEQSALPPAPPPAPLPEIPSRPPLDTCHDEARASGPRCKQARWRDKPPTEKQLRFLREHGRRRPVANRGEASDLIAAALRQEEQMPGYLMILREWPISPLARLMPPPLCHVDLSKLDVPPIADLPLPKGA